MKIRALLIASVLFSGIAAATSASAATVVLLRYKNWMVERVHYANGSYACAARVANPVHSVTVWTYPNRRVKLQFYATAWHFGDRAIKANIRVHVDNRPVWILTGATATRNSILFTYANSNRAYSLMNEISAGYHLYIRNARGTVATTYSLAGSAAALSRLTKCTNAISRIVNGY